VNSHRVPRGRPGRTEHSRRGLAAVCTLALAAAISAPLERAAGTTLPPDAVKLLEAPPLASPSVDPAGHYLLLVHKRRLLDRRQLTALAVSVAGRRVDPRTHAPHAPLDYYGFSVVDLTTRERSELSLPEGAIVGFPFWAPDGSRFAFTLTTPRGVELWIGDPARSRARRLVDGLNAVFSQPCVWTSDSRHVLCRRIRPEGAVAADGRDAAGAFAQPAEISGGFFETSALSAADAAELLESQLQIIDVATGRPRNVGARAAIKSVDPSPDRGFLLVTRIARPYPRVDGVDPLATVTEVWDRFGRVVETLPATQRAAQWQANEPSTLVWVQRAAGADRVMVQPPPFIDAPEPVFATEHRFAGLDWLEGTDSALIGDYVAERRQTRRWLIDVGSGGTRARQLGSYSGDADTAGGLPLQTSNGSGRRVVAVDEHGFFVRGEAPAADGRSAPYLDKIDLDTGARQRVWSRESDGYESIVGLVSRHAQQLLTRYETAATPPNYFVTDLAAGTDLQLTHNVHPAPALQRVERVALSYTRADGVPLSATLYVPAGLPAPSLQPQAGGAQAGTAPATLPLVVWAYPKEVGDRVVSDGPPSAERYMGSDRALKLFFLLCGYAVMDDVSMPIVGSSETANDSFVEQVVANARATVEAAAGTGLIDPNRIGVAGHSYGAFMVANLLAHSHLFRAGAALSGAYNRTLTPFGFQTERRTLWEAPQTYLTMSPLLYSNRIDAPLLLVHGMADNNAGTPPIQSLQFYQAIRGNGGDTELLLLPREGHTYRAKESVLETAAAMLGWFDRYLKASPPTHGAVQTSAALIR
jgi:dipeptidyl aminopeptidase/acylaminoacyl peptidase